MCHAFLTDASFYHFSTRTDESIAGEVRARGCDRGGVLHSARYPCKPRGIRCAMDASYERRLSFCCARGGCRRQIVGLRPSQGRPDRNGLNHFLPRASSKRSFTFLA